MQSVYVDDDNVVIQSNSHDFLDIISNNAGFVFLCAYEPLSTPTTLPFASSSDYPTVRWRTLLRVLEKSPRVRLSDCFWKMLTSDKGLGFYRRAHVYKIKPIIEQIISPDEVIDRLLHPRSFKVYPKGYNFSCLLSLTKMEVTFALIIHEKTEKIIPKELFQKIIRYIIGIF